MRITITVTGTSPLLMHNPRMVDPDFALNREIKAITSKRKKTDTDLKEIERLEWYGGLYEVNGVVVQPTSKLRKSIVNAARVRKLGKAVERALAFAELHVPLDYDGPRAIDEVFAAPRFHSRLSVGVGNKRVMRVRPQFFPWGLTVTGVFVPDVGINLDELTQIIHDAGLIEGIGDNRVNGYGRYTATVEARD